MHVAGSTPGDCGSMAAPMKLSGNNWLMRKHSSLQIPAQVAEVLKSPMWCDMKVARGEKMVRSLPRSFIRRSWLLSIDSRNSSSLIFRSAALGPAAGLPRLAICWLRQFSSALGAVV